MLTLSPVLKTLQLCCTDASDTNSPSCWSKLLTTLIWWTEKTYIIHVNDQEIMRIQNQESGEFMVMCTYKLKFSLKSYHHKRLLHIGNEVRVNSVNITIFIGLRFSFFLSQSFCFITESYSVATASLHPMRTLTLDSWHSLAWTSLLPRL